jgi:hypothetical protein
MTPPEKAFPKERRTLTVMLWNVGVFGWRWMLIVKPGSNLDEKVNTVTFILLPLLEWVIPKGIATP